MDIMQQDNGKRCLETAIKYIYVYVIVGSKASEHWLMPRARPNRSINFSSLTAQRNATTNKTICWLWIHLYIYIYTPFYFSFCLIYRCALVILYLFLPPFVQCNLTSKLNYVALTNNNEQLLHSVCNFWSLNIFDCCCCRNLLLLFISHQIGAIQTPFGQYNLNIFHEQ